MHVFADDVIFYAKTKEEHDELVEEGLKLMKANNLQLKISKCLFYAHNFEYLGHIVSEEGIKANPKKVQAVKKYPRPINVKQVQKFLGMCAYYRRYVPNFSRIAKPITLLLKKDQPFVWSDTQQAAFEELKRILMEDVL